MRRMAAGALLAFLAAPTALSAQAVPQGSPAAQVEDAYRRTPTFRMDPFRYTIIPHWGIVVAAGAMGANNALSFRAARAIIYLQDHDSLGVGDALDILGRVPVGKGLSAAAQGEGGLYVGGPFSRQLNLAFSAQGRGYGSLRLDDKFVSLLRDGNAAQQSFTLGNSQGAGLATLEAGIHAVLRFGPLGSVDGAHVNLGVGGRYIRPMYFARATSTVSNGGVILVTGDSVFANVGVRLDHTPTLNATSHGAGAAADLMARVSWPTSGFALEAMVANLGRVTVHEVATDARQVTVATTQLSAVKDAVDAADSAAVKDTTDVKVTLPRIVRFTASAWGNRVLQLDVSTTLPVGGDFASRLVVDIGTTWRFVSNLPLRAGIVLGSDQKIGYTGGVALEGRGTFLQIMGQSFGGLARSATGYGARLELGAFF